MADETTQRTKRKRPNKGSNKRRKKAKPNVSHPNRKKNWIESCSESAHRIPSNCVAPICCVVTRSELVEDRLLPGVMVGDDSKKPGNDSQPEVQVINEDGTEANTEEAADNCNVSSVLDGSCTDVGNNHTANTEKDSSIEQVPLPSAAVAKNDEEKNTSFFSSNKEASDMNIDLSQSLKQGDIATLKSVDTSDAPFKVSDTILVNGEEKKVFIPVKRDASSVGPTQVRLEYIDIVPVSYQ